MIFFQEDVEILLSLNIFQPYQVNLTLKKQTDAQEAKMQQMATELLRLVNDKKQAAAGEAGGTASENVVVVMDGDLQVI